jgi:hypothetical protein
MSELTDIQSEFAFNLARLLLWLEEQGYQVGLGESWRTTQQAKWYEEQGIGTKNSLHRDRIAQDIVIRRNGMEVDTDNYRRAGEAWKALNPNNRYGGDFKSGDMQHFSRGYAGRA